MRKLFGVLVLGAIVSAGCNDMPTSSEPLASQPTSGPAFSMAGAIPGQYIVVLHDSVVDVPAVAHRLAAEHGATVHFTYTSALRGFAVANLPSQAAAALQHNPHVTYVEADEVITTTATTQLNATWGIDRIDQRALPRDNSYTYDASGNGVTVYVMDTGIRYSHVEFGGRARAGYDAYGGTGADCHGHGTHVAGTVGGATYGVAKQVALVSVRVLDCTGSGSWSGFVAGADWISRNATPGRAVMNASIGGPISSSADAAVQALVVKGIVPVVAAGNNAASACNYSPARAAGAITVGATTSSDARASYSNFGSCVDWFAPGSSIVSASYSSNTGVTTKSGTSMASPHVAGAAALYLELNPLTAVQQVRDALFAATTKGVVTSSNSTNNHLLYSRFPVSAPVNLAPLASMAHACTGLSCNFYDRSVDPDGKVASRGWAFSNGVTSTLKSASHTFAAAGTYTVQLSVTDNAGTSATTSRSVTVSALPATSITLTAAPYAYSGSMRVYLAWTGATSTNVDIYRNGVLRTTTANGGTHTDILGSTVSGTYAYRVCAAGTTTCSNTVNVVF